MAENKSKFKNEHYYVIKGWMINELDLRDTELLVYAIIYGLSQGENQYFTGSLQYLADATRRTKRSIISALESLVKKELLIKKEEFINGMKFCKYQCGNYNGSEEISSETVKKFHQGSEKISP
ncbi:MAG: helix-turn-helix domain-containing protein, partial [Oscillospiraceae bacterium]|nr:helix-turn-helix domain-containing protein [Oscillospiraceae bacterium]